VNLLRRIVDVYRHYGEYPTQRQYRRYLEGVPQATPYILSTVKEITEERAQELRQELVRQFLDERRNNPIVGVTMGLTESEQRAMHGDR
jgi:hypothetical protein